MARIHSFDPIADANAEVLIFGSMPGRASLAAGQYYAHGQNIFWRVMAELLQFDATLPYALRVQALKSARIALWDVLRSCTREGSLDSMIANDTEVPNDFQTFFSAHKKITYVFFNGAKAEACFKRHMPGEIDSGSIRYLRLPSTSPANASMSFERKFMEWQAILRPSPII